MEIMLLGVGLVIGLILMYFVLRPKLESTKHLDTKIEEQNQQLWDKNQIAQKELQELQQKLKQLGELNHSKITEFQIEIAKLKTQEEELLSHIQKTRENADKDNDLIYQKSFDLMQEHLSQAADEMAQRYRNAERVAEKAYLDMLAAAASTSSNELANMREEIRLTQKELDELRAKADAAIAAAKREEEKLLEIDKYKILVTDLDLLEINRLREIAPYFRNARAIYKIIWESYYRNLTTEMINRVVGTGTHTGVYKLTNLTNQKIYIGQAVDITERFRQHVKCGLGIDTPTNMLYAAMMKDGVENFTFEVLEECERSQLNDREKYYIAFYRAQEHGYNMSRGGARN